MLKGACMEMIGSGLNSIFQACPAWGQGKLAQVGLFGMAQLAT